MKTATFEIPMADATYPIGTPVPTQVRVHAVQVGQADKVGTWTWDALATLRRVLIQFNEATESGVWQGFVELVGGPVILKSFPQIAFTIPQQPVSVTYRSPSGFTVTVG